MVDTRRYRSFELYRRLLLEARSCWHHIVVLSLLSLLSIPLALLTPLPLKLVVDSVIGTQPLPSFSRALWLGNGPPGSEGVLLLAVGLTIAIALLVGLQALATQMVRTKAAEQLALSFRTKLFRHAQRLSFLYHDNVGINDSIYRIQYDAPAIQWIAVEGIIPFLTAGITLVGMLIVITRIDWQLALVALGIAPALYLATRYFGPRMRTQWYEIRNLETGAFSVVQEALAALRLVQAFRQEDRERDRFVKKSSVSMSAKLRAARSEGMLGLAIGLTTATGTALVLYVGVNRVQAGFVTLGDLLLVMAYLVQLLGPIAALGRMTGHMQNSLASADRAFTLLDRVPEVVEEQHAIKLNRASGLVMFRDVSFNYATHLPILQNITIDIPAGTRVGIMGMTGTGKTTFLNLLMRFYDPTEGAILLDGVDIRKYKIDDLRNQFSIVLQESILLSSTIEENIAYGRRGASHDEIVTAAKNARAHDFISRLPQGYSSTVGERGMTLSGGERQRIALARAFLKDSPILVLDEPTSSVDAGTEANIIETLGLLSRGKTVFLITHRMNPLALCDVLFKIVDGKMIVVHPTYEFTSG